MTRNPTIGIIALALVATLTFGVVAANVSIPYSETTAVGNSTAQIEVIGTETSHDLDVTVWGVDSQGSETAVDNGVLNATSSTSMFVFGEVDAAQYPEYRIEVTEPSDFDSANETLSVGSIDVYRVDDFDGGGGGGLLDGGILSPIEDNVPVLVGVVAVLALVLAAWRVD